MSPGTGAGPNPIATAGTSRGVMAHLDPGAGAGGHLVFVEPGTTGSGMAAFARAAALGLTPVIATTDPSRYAGPAATGVRVLACDTGAPAGLPRALRSALGDIAGVTTTSASHVATAASAASALGLPGNPPEAVAICRDRSRTRRTLLAAGLPSPAFAVIEPDGDLWTQILTALSRIALPCVVKPVDGTGSPSVTLCSTGAQVRARCREIMSVTNRVRGRPTAGAALIEGYLDGPEYGLEMISSGGAHHCVGITAKRSTAPPFFVERGHVFPAPLPPDAVAGLSDVASRALTATGITHGVTHAELKLVDGRGYVVEINAHPAGGMIPRLVEHACGFDLLDAHLRAVSGLPPLPMPAGFTPAGIAFILPPDDPPPAPGAVLRDVGGLGRARAVPGVDTVAVTAAPGAAVRTPRGAGDHLGYVIAHACCHAELERALETALGHIRPVLGSELDRIGMT